MSALVASAFRALGTGPSRHELALVADALRDSSDQQALELLNAAAENREAFHRLAYVADAAGSSGFVALDLLVVLTAGADALTRS